MGDLERNVLGVVLRREIETRLVPEAARRCTPSFWGRTRRPWAGFRSGWIRVQTQLTWGQRNFSLRKWVGGWTQMRFPGY